MNEIRVKPYWTVLAVIVALSIAGGIGYGIGSDSMNHKWIEASQTVVPGVVDYVIERCGEDWSLAESYRELIKNEGLLLFIEGTWMLIDFEGYLDYMEKFG
jgi:hypothetical protein